MKIPCKQPARSSSGGTHIALCLALAVTLAAALVQSAGKPSVRLAAAPPPNDYKNKAALMLNDMLTDACKSTSEMKQFRKNLLQPCWAKDELQRRLNKCYVDKEAVELPDESVFVFYEPMPLGQNLTTPERADRADNPHYSPFVTILWLPAADDKAHKFDEQLKCCYPVWQPTKYDCNAK